ncbi:hypothetical protein [Microbacterium oleivorans]|uniref:Uncharacterized protein n=1 Tax=Microbacterium oleivorans TaxID=273677 RepID=A0A7D5JWN0_9MICO|nr:hypothetical protein [Microbacterium oleivorans]QLD10303.1 hypothetical protein HW566_03845 [Microbacterium oleivorans]
MTSSAATRTPPERNASTHATAVRSASESHEHGWITESSHRTSDGTIRYVRCAICNARRVDADAIDAAAPVAASREIRQPISPG